MPLLPPSTQTKRVVRVFLTVLVGSYLPLKADLIVLQLCAQNWDGRQSISGVIFQPKLGAPGPATGPDGCAEINYYLTEDGATIELTIKFPSTYRIIAGEKLRLTKGERPYPNYVVLMRKEEYKRFKGNALNEFEEASKVAHATRMSRDEFLARVSESSGAPVPVVDEIIRGLEHSSDKSERTLAAWYRGSDQQ